MLEHIVLLPIFVVMGFWWWLLIIAASCFVIWSLEYDNLFSATATLLGTIVLMTVFGSSQLLEYILSGWGTLVVIAGYLACGVVWSFIKWYLYLIDRRADYIREKASWLKNEGIEGTDIPEDQKDAWLKYLVTNTEFAVYAYNNNGPTKNIVVTLVPLATENKTKIVTWMTYWPWSLVWTMLADIVKRVFEHIYNMLLGWLQAISNWVFSGINNDF